MIARLLSFNRIGSYKNPIWHIGTESEVISVATPLNQINEYTIIPFETLNKDRIHQIENLDFISKSNIIIQFSIHEIDQIMTINNKNLRVQIWVDQPLKDLELQILKKYQNIIEIVFVPMGQFDCIREAERLISTRNFICRLLLVPKKSIHDPFPTLDNYYDWLDIFKNKSFTLNTIILKQHFEESSHALQNFFCHNSRQNILEYAKNKSSVYFFFITISQFANLISFNYFSNILMSLMKPHKPIVFQTLFVDIKQFYLFIKNIFSQSEWRIRKVLWLIMIRIYYSLLKLYSEFRFHYFPLFIHKSYMITLLLMWPIRKVYWVLKFQFEKRIRGLHKNEL